tara:strand:+ start:34 stop:318 length:285 start_codon:yes stop_codon:yes gene_type:complete
MTQKTDYTGIIITAIATAVITSVSTTFSVQRTMTSEITELKIRVEQIRTDEKEFVNVDQFTPVSNQVIENKNILREAIEKNISQDLEISVLKAR